MGFMAQIILVIIIYLIICAVLGVKMNRIGYSGLLWFFATFFGGIVSFVLASSLPNRNLELLKVEEEALLDQQLRQASLPVTEGGAVVPRATISDDLTRAGEV